ncbi:3-hydroxyacyl-CoA dehydrogenase family protein [Candidatus Nitrosocosmicus franklandus]|uniref:Putative 3-hydroxybutyryl-CoA dehydrogenase n=1 Tax=Candidatus Nitrosocosmicus franklandianus TaxID=1798806 RepID=A0A484IEY6_9ARCH|nr:3-hydroxyacyl-CoA dehydrogenase family protein [Candidatus Nitrosocosmicus franklandus]VFJ15328.1 putative 3-hydroxybutyryl-CoA dehydrogenase [Candidatus Nitrosocosmicus franklandus]
MTIKNITVLGSGIMGHGIAQVSAMAGYKVFLRDIEQVFLDKAMEKIKWSLQKLTEKNKITSENAVTIYNNITPVIDLKKATENTDLIIEAVPEDFKLKEKVYGELNEIVKNEVIFASNTSTLPITELSKLTNHPENFIGVHFFNPPQLMKLVEVIPGKDTDKQVVDELTRFVHSIDKNPVICKKDVSGFIVNRIFIPLVHEALHSMDRDKVSMDVIDSAVKFKLNFPMGIFELADYTGLDVIYKASYEMSLRDKHVLLMHPRIKELYEGNQLGQKTGKGFYEYKKENYERVNLTEEKAAQYEPLSIVGVAANNAAWLVENEVCTLEDLNLALSLGMGLKTGIFDLVRKLSPSRVLENLKSLGEQQEFYHPNKYIENFK